MPVIVLTSAAGAPGCTTTALGLALTWPGPTVLVEADPAGSSVSAGYLRGTVDHSHGLLNLALGGGRDNLPAAILTECLVLEQQPDRRLLLGLAEAAQASALQPWWEPIGAALVELDEAGYTVLVDAGRITQGSFPLALLDVADLVLMVCRATLSSAVRSQPATAALAESLGRQGREDALGLVVVGASDYQPAEVAGALGAPLLVRLGDDPKMARVLSDGGIEKKFATSALAREYRNGCSALAGRVAQRRERVRGLAAARLGTPAPGPAQPQQVPA